MTPSPLDCLIIKLPQVSGGGNQCVVLPSRFATIQPMLESRECRQRMLLRFLPRLAAVIALALWWGGLTFYAVFVVPVGVDVLGGATEQGFITQQVSNSINLLAVLTLVTLVWNGVASRRETGRLMKISLIATWLVMAATQAVLFVVHPQLDGMLDATSHSLARPESFHALHEFYLTVVGVQWFAGLLHLMGVVYTGFRNGVTG
jgi:hypothetical protein